MLSKTSRYGVRALLHIAANTSEAQLVGVRDLAQMTEISEHMLSKVLQFLTRRDIIKSKKGRKGGFYMTKSQKDRKLMHVIRELGSEDLLSACLLGQKHCTTKQKCPYHQRVAWIRAELRAIYAADTIEETAKKIIDSNSSHKKLKQ